MQIISSQPFFDSLSALPGQEENDIMDINNDRRYTMIFFMILLITLLLLVPLSSVRAERKPSVHLLATGGTIAGKAASESATTGYEAGALGVKDLLGSLL